MTDLPPGWEWTTLGELAEVVGGVTKDTKKQSDPDIPLVPYLRVANVQRGHLDLSNVTHIRVSEDKRKKLELRPGDVLLNEGGDRDKLGRGWVWEGQIPGCIHQNHVFRARIRAESMLPKFLAYYVNEFGKPWFEEHGTQSVNLASISLAKIRLFPVPVPPLAEQRRIVAALEDHLSRLDGANHLVETNQRRLKLLLKRSLVQAVPIPGPDRWKLMRVHEVGRIDLGRQRHPDWHSGRHMRPYLRVANVFEDRISTTDVMTMDFPPEVFERYRLNEGDILLNEGQSPEYLGRPAMYRGDPKEVAFTNSLLRFRAGPNVLPEWALLVFRRHMHAGRFLREVRITTNIAHLSATRLKNVEFPVPPLAEQQKILTEVGEKLGHIERLGEATSRVSARCAVLRKSLLAEAFAGRLVEQGPNDEPASELLARIRADREAAEAARNPRKSRKTKAPRAKAAASGRKGGTTKGQGTLL